METNQRVLSYKFGKQPLSVQRRRVLNTGRVNTPNKMEGQISYIGEIESIVSKLIALTRAEDQTCQIYFDQRFSNVIYSLATDGSTWLIGEYADKRVFKVPIAISSLPNPIVVPIDLL